MLNGPGEVQTRIFYLIKVIVKVADTSSASPPPPPLKRQPQPSVLYRVNKVLLRATASVKFLRFSFLQFFPFYSQSRKFFFNPCSKFFSNHGTKSDSKMNTKSWNKCINYSFE